MHPYRTAPPILPPPPRRIPWTVAAQLRFGGVFGTVGWAVFLFGLMMSSIFISQSEAVTMRWFRGPIAREAGEVTATSATNMKENNSRVYAVEAIYEHDGGRRFVRSYTTWAPPAVGSPVTVEIDLADTSHARIAGLRTRPFGAFVAFVVIFPLVGLALAAAQLWRSRRPLDLLRRGLVAKGTFVEKHPTNTRINRRTVYRMVFSYEDDKERRFRVEARTHTPEVLEDEAHEQVLYDPYRPGYATLVDHLPGAPRVDEQGRIAPGSPFKAFAAAALPVVAALATAVALLAM
jgi:hypothetical protein